MGTKKAKSSKGGSLALLPPCHKALEWGPRAGWRECPDHTPLPPGPRPSLLLGQGLVGEGELCAGLALKPQPRQSLALAVPKASALEVSLVVWVVCYLFLILPL